MEDLRPFKGQVNLMWHPAGQFVTDSDDSIPYSSFQLKGLTCFTDHYHIKYRENFGEYFNRF